MSRKPLTPRSRSRHGEPEEFGVSYLGKLADTAMLARGLDTGYSSEAVAQVAGAVGPAQDATVIDMRALPWCSIDNGEGEVVTSKDLDQLTVASTEGGVLILRVAISDVDALVEQDTAVDTQARQNTTTVFCPGKMYPMLAPRFSEDLCSLLEGQDRLALVTEMTFAPGGKVAESKIFRALVRNQAALNYDSTGAWLEGRREPPLALADHQDVLESVRLQDQIAQRYQQHRRQRGSLTLESLEARAVVEGDLVVEMAGQQRNRATELIENVMVACNGCASRYLTQKGFPTFQRIVRRPKHWSRIVTLAQELGCELPEEPESKALQQFLEAQRASRPQQFPDLSLQVLKLLGRGEYVVELPDQPPIGHFGLAVREYSHSTAPNRRYPDLITQRLLKAALAEEPCPYGEDELEELARHCSEQEANAQKIERHMAKSAAAAMLRNRLGETFEAVASGHNERATWVRLLSMPVEGMLDGWAPLGRKLRVRLERVDIKKGFIDFSRLSDPR